MSAAAHKPGMSIPQPRDRSGQFAATSHAEPTASLTHIMGRPDDNFENTIQKIAFHTMAMTHWREEGMELMQRHSRDTWERSQLCFTARQAVDLAACRIIDEAGLPREAYEFRGDEDMGRYARYLEPALEMVDAEYKAALPNVKNGGLFRATDLDVTRKALRYEIEAAAAPADG